MSELRGIGWSKVLVVMALGCGDPDRPPPAGPGPVAGTGGSGAQAGTGGSGGSGGSTGGSGGGAGAATGGSGGSSGGSGGAGGSSGGAGGSTGGTGGSSGAAGGGGSSGSGAAGGTGEPTGFIQFGTLYDFSSVGSAYSFASARFDRGDAPSTATCTTQTFGPCSLYTCEESSDPPEPVAPPSAGTITIDADVGEFSTSLEPDSTGSYPSMVVTGTLQGEEVVSVIASGGEVPAFSHTVTFPLVLLLTAPALPTGESVIMASRTDDLSLTWDRGVEGLSFAIQATSGVSFVCNVPSTDGTMTIPAAGLATLPANTTLLLMGTGVDHVTAGDYDVSITHANGVMNPDRTERMEVLVP